MAAFTAKLQVTTPRVLTPPDRDAVVNTFNFTMESTTRSADAAVIAEEVEDIYEAIIAYLSDEWNWGQQVYKFYDLSDPIPRAPFYEATHGTGVAPTTQATLPPEVCLCLSYQGFKASGIPQARRRGRTYYGPLGISANSDGVPAAGFVTGLVAGGDQLLTASQAASSWEWVVRSSVTGTTIPVDNGWVDNAFDTQRRRGRKPLTRTTFS